MSTIMSYYARALAAIEDGGDRPARVDEVILHPNGSTQSVSKN